MTVIPGLPSSSVTTASPKFATTILTPSGGDDTTALNAAATAGATVLLGPGTFLLNTGALKIDQSNVTLRGAGMGTTTLVLLAGLSTGSNNIWNAVRINSSLSGTPSRLTNVEVTDLTIDAQGGSQVWQSGGIPGGLVAYAVDGLTVERVKVINGRTSNIAAVACTKVAVRNNVCDTCYYSGASNPINVYGSLTAGAATDTIITGNLVKHSTSVAISGTTNVGTTGTFTTSAPHLLAALQTIKVTGCSVNDYNGYWIVASTPTASTFTVTLNTTPAGPGTGGSALVFCDRGIYCTGLDGKKTLVTNNISEGATVPIMAELSDSSGDVDVRIANNIVDDWRDYGIAAQNAGAVAVNGLRIGLTGNVVRGRDGTTEFGMASRGSVTGMAMGGVSHGEVSHNIISNTRVGISAGLGGNVEEDNLSLESNTVFLAADANGSGISVSKGNQANALRRLEIKANTIDGGASATSKSGVWLDGNIQDFTILGNIVRGMGWSGYYLSANSGVGPQFGSLTDNKAVDCGSASNASAQLVSGFSVEGSSASIDVSHCWAYDTRGPKLQKYGLSVLSGATTIRAIHNHFENNLTAELNDGTSGVGLVVDDARDTTGLGFPMAGDPRMGALTGSLAANGRIIYTRVTAGAGLCSKLGVYIAVVDSGAPTSPTGTRQVNTTGVWGGTGIVRAKIVAVNANGESVASTEASATLVATTDTILWAWTAPTGVTGITSYHVYRTAIGGAAGTEAGYVDTGSATASYVDTGSALTGSATPPATNATQSDQIGVAVYANTGAGRSALPGTRKQVSALTTPVANTLAQVALGAAVQINMGDWLALGIAGQNTTVQSTVVTNGTIAAGLCGFQDGATGTPIPPSSPSCSAGTSARVPSMVGIP